jgi:hypothetical protein
VPPKFRQSYSYAYPNANSYNQLIYRGGSGPGYNGRSLRHGYVFGYKPAPATGPAQPGPAPGQTEPGMDPIPVTFNRHIDYENSKMFQFNPVELPMRITMMQTASKAEEAKGGNDKSAQVGVANTDLHLFFDRTHEIYYSNSGRGTPVWGDLGVQVDIFDLLKVISGGNESDLSRGSLTRDEELEQLGGLVQAGSTNYLSGLMLDAVATGSQVQFTPFAVVFNPNLAVHIQRLQGLGFSYIRFTQDLVPTTVQVDMSLEIANMGTMSYVTSDSRGTVAPTPTEPPPGVANPPPVAPSSSGYKGPQKYVS